MSEESLIDGRFSGALSGVGAFRPAGNLRRSHFSGQCRVAYWSRPTLTPGAYYLPAFTYKIAMDQCAAEEDTALS